MALILSSITDDDINVILDHSAVITRNLILRVIFEYVMNGCHAHEIVFQKLASAEDKLRAGDKNWNVR